MYKSIGVLATFCLYASSSAAGLRGVSDSSARRLLHNDPAFIHKGCSGKKGLRPEYTEHGMFGRGWYCSDRKECGVGKSLQCDRARIHAGCRRSAGLKPKYDAKTATWYCSDALPSHGGKPRPTCPYTKKLTPCAAYEKHGVHFGGPRCTPDGRQCKASGSHPDAFTMYGSTPADNPVWGEAHMSLGRKPDGSQCKPTCPHLEIYLNVRETYKWGNGCGATLWIGSISPVKPSQSKCFNDYKERCFKSLDPHVKGSFKGKTVGPHVAVSNEWLERHSGKSLPHFTFSAFAPAKSKGTCHVKH